MSILGRLAALDERVLPVPRYVRALEPRGQRSRELWSTLRPDERDILREAVARGRRLNDARNLLIAADLAEQLIARLERLMAAVLVTGLALWAVGLVVLAASTRASVLGLLGWTVSSVIPVAGGLMLGQFLMGRRFRSYYQGARDAGLLG